MGDFFGGLRSGIQFPQVVMNQGPMPDAGGLPAPLHDTPDSRINYGSSLLGDITPYAYGEPGYLSSQNAYLNIPHKIQKIVPVVYLPEAKVGARDFFDLSHPIDDGDLAFVLRLDRSSLFCTGLKNADMRRAGLGTAIDPLINLCTLNYILSGLQLGFGPETDRSNLWAELFHNLDKDRFGKPGGMNSRDYQADPITFGDVIHVVRHCVRPFGVTRGSEKQGGQDEATISPATWPVSFVVSLTLDGKESNVLNIWHHHELHAGNDLVLRLKLMPLRPYTLNHYYKGVKRQTWDLGREQKYVWQLVPDLFHIEMPSKQEMREAEQAFATMPEVEARDGQRYTPLREFRTRAVERGDRARQNLLMLQSDHAWQEFGYWHIGRSQVMTGKYGTEEYWHNDLANTLRTNHLDITLQPMFFQLPMVFGIEGRPDRAIHMVGAKADGALGQGQGKWTASLGLEKLHGGDRPTSRRRVGFAPTPAARRDPPSVQGSANNDAIPVPSLTTGTSAAQEQVEEPFLAPPASEPSLVAEPDWLGRLEFTDELAAVPVQAESTSDLVVPGLGTGKKAGTKASAGKRGSSKPIGGSLLKPDGTSEASMVGML